MSGIGGAVCTAGRINHLSREEIDCRLMLCQQGHRLTVLHITYLIVTLH
jgi:hypothetical protein